MRAGVLALIAGPPCILNPTFCTFAVLNHVNYNAHFWQSTQPLVTAQPAGLASTELSLALGKVRVCFQRRGYTSGHDVMRCVWVVSSDKMRMVLLF